MSEPKPFASLSSGLLARKGAARPAMRPQGFGQSGGDIHDLGWNDMGFEAPKATPAERDEAHDAFGEDIVEHPRALHPTGLSPVDSPVHGQQAALAESFAQSYADADEAFDEEYDETAELYDPAAADGADGEVEEVEEAEVAAPVFAVPAIKPARQLAPEPTPAPVAPRRATRARSVPGSKAKAAFTLRLDKDRHLKLRLACAVDGRSAQMLVTEALDRLLAAMPEVDDLAGKAKNKG
jgi:hypothetical protein